MTFRDLILKIVPPWLKRTNGAKLLYTFALHIDILVEMVRVAVLHRFPGGTLYEKSLAVLGRDRRISRGRTETANTYRERLRNWRQSHKRAGHPVELLRKIQEHFAPDGLESGIFLTSYLGRQYLMLSDGSYTISQVASPPNYATAEGSDYWGDPGTWGDGGYWGEGSTRWARLWLQIDLSETIGDDTAWGISGAWGDGGVWGRDLDPERVIDYKVAPSEWKGAHINPLWVVLNNGGDPVYLEVN